MLIEEVRARQVLSRGGIVLLAIVEEVPTTAPGLKDILIAREIPGVSPPELILMPPFSEIEIEIAVDVVWGKPCQLRQHLIECHP